MKRPVAIFLIIFYLLPVIGFSFNIHWCCNKINSISFGVPKHDRCNHCNATSSCCKDVHITVKITDNQHGSSFLTVAGNQINCLIAVVNPIPVTTFSHKRIFDFTSYHAPPFACTQPVYIVNSVFRV